MGNTEWIYQAVAAKRAFFLLALYQILHVIAITQRRVRSEAEFTEIYRVSPLRAQ